MLRPGHLCVRLLAIASCAGAIAGCEPEGHTGVEVTLVYSAAIREVLISSHFDDGTEPFTPRTFTLSAPSGEVGSGTIVIELAPDRGGGQLNVSVNAHGIEHKVGILIVRESIVPITFDLTCGDGVITGAETCDDGNLNANDACDASCRKVPGFVCGDGLTRGAEKCDDSNTSSGDGCDSTCELEPGFICGDGLLRGDEVCDDLNTMANDGCDDHCTVEVGWTCTGTTTEPTRCHLCGDGLLQSDEECDDSNRNADDGCSRDCTIEQGWSCDQGEPTVCSRCGDGIKQSPETCDDMNSAPSDGCDEHCAIEVGYECSGEGPGTCKPICGDAMIIGVETCDDANVAGGDGCDPMCAVEGGWTCIPPAIALPSRCFPTADTSFVDITCPVGMGGDGTLDRPYCVLAGAVAAGRARTVLLPGDYVGKVVINFDTELVGVGSATISSAMADTLTINTGVTATVRDLAITGVGGAGGGVKVDTSSVSFYDCTIGPSGVIGLKNMGNGGFVRLERNFIHDNALGGVKLDGTAGHLLYNNIIARNGDFGGMLIMESPETARIVNNTIADNVGAMNEIGGITCTTAALIVNSVLWNNLSRVVASPAGVGPLCRIEYALMQTDPANFSNVIHDMNAGFEGDRYHLGATSMAIDQGDNSRAPPDDYDRDLRPINGTVDLGADERR